MIKINGNGDRVLGTGRADWETCIDACFDDPICMLVYMFAKSEICMHYFYANKYKSLVVEEANEGNFLVFKTILPSDSCPASYTDINFTIGNNGGTYSWTKTDNGWSFEGCMNGWKRFERENGLSVCLKTYPKNAISRNDAKSMCRNNDALIYGVSLAGVASVEETQWIHEKLLELNPTIMFEGFWIGGMRKHPGYETGRHNIDWSDDGDDYTEGEGALGPDNFWASNLTDSNEPEDCLMVAYLPGREPQLINDVKCDVAPSTIKGVVCGYKLWD